MQNGLETTINGWQERRMGLPKKGVRKPLLPQGSRVRRVNLDTHTNIEYGEKTWTTGQTVRDILQNHLDAHTEVFFEKLVGTVLDMDQLINTDLTKKQLENFDEFTYRLYLYCLGLKDRTSEAEDEILREMGGYTNDLPLRSEFVVDGIINSSALRRELALIQEQPLLIHFKILDQNNPKASEWVSNQQLASEGKYAETLTEQKQAVPFHSSVIKKRPSINFRYQIQAAKIADTGSGFDNTLTAFYKSTKTGKRHLRGKFGEGDKMSRTHLVRHGAKIRSRSRYYINSGQNKERWWQHRPYVAPDKTVKLKGAEIEMPKTENSNYGSETLVDIRSADREFQDEFAANTDPRLKGAGLAANCLEYNQSKYYYPLAEFSQAVQPVGVSLEAGPEFQYVQGLRVEEVQSPERVVYRAGSQKRLFSYNFLDSSLLKGRDRNQIKEAVSEQILAFWKHAESSVLLQALIQRVYLEPHLADRSSNVFAEYIEESATHAIIVQHQPSKQGQRTRDLLLGIFPEAMGLEQGKKYLFFTDSEAEEPQNKKLLSMAEKHGFVLLKVNWRFFPEDLKKIVQFHKDAYGLASLEDIKESAQGWKNEEQIEDEKTEAVGRVFAEALQEFKQLMKRKDLNVDDFLLSSPLYSASVDSTKEQPVEADFNFHDGKFFLVIRLELIVSQDGKIDAYYWKYRMLVEMFATVGGKGKDVLGDRTASLLRAQKEVQELLDESLQLSAEDEQELLRAFTYKQREERKYQDSFFEKFKDRTKEIAAWRTLERARSLKMTLSEIEDLATGFHLLPEPYQRECVESLMDKIVIENGQVGYCNYSAVKGQEPSFEFKAHLLTDLEVVGELEGKIIYKFPDSNRIIMMADFPEGTVVKKGDTRFVFVGSEILVFKDKELEFYGPRNSYESALKFNGQCLSSRVYNQGLAEWEKLSPAQRQNLKEQWVSEFKGDLEELEMLLPDSGELKTSVKLQGIVETPLPIEYGKNEWDNPVRVFQDIVQNHLDASGGQKLIIQFEVTRQGERLWVAEDELGEKDIIVGFAVMDNGSGYAPDDLGTMGKSSKKSPLFAGKYGEGQKLLAAAAARNGMELAFSSLARGESGKKFRWTGRVGTKTQEIIVRGDAQESQRVIFNLESSEASEEETFTSMTALRLPVDPNRYEDPEWQSWVSVIDPRQKDRRGHGGLSRYVIDLRDNKGENIIDMGYMRILLDEPGVVYENGLLIDQKEGSMALGYDVPEVSSTRERNAYDQARLEYYIGHAFANCKDPRLATTVLQIFKERYLSLGTRALTHTSAREKDLNFSSLDLYQMPAKPYWNLACAIKMPGYVVVSKENLARQIKELREKIQSPVVNQFEDKTRMAERLQLAEMTLANLPHIPEDHLIDKPGYSYSGFREIFPTAEEYVLNLAEQEVEVEAGVLEELRERVAVRANEILLLMGDLLRSDVSRPAYEKLITQTATSPDPKVLSEKSDQLVRQVDFWKNRQNLQSHPESVFVAPASAGYLGTVRRGRLGINEALFTAEMIGRLDGTIAHELVHKLTGLGDYSPEFVIMLLKLAERNLRLN